MKICKIEQSTVENKIVELNRKIKATKVEPLKAIYREFLKFLLEIRKSSKTILIPDDVINQYIEEINIVWNVVVRLSDIPKELIQLKTRKREIVMARMMMCWGLLYSREKHYVGRNVSLAVIGNMINGMDHATVLHAEKTINNLCETDKSIKLLIAKLEYLIDEGYRTYIWNKLKSEDNITIFDIDNLIN